MSIRGRRRMETQKKDVKNLLYCRTILMKMSKTWKTSRDENIFCVVLSIELILYAVILIISGLWFIFLYWYIKLSVCMFVSLWVYLLPINLAPLRSTPHDIMNQHDPGSALVYNSFTLTVFWEVPLWCKFQVEAYLVSSHFSAMLSKQTKRKLKLKISKA